MSLLGNIIKGADLQDGVMRVIPLRRHLLEEGQLETEEIAQEVRDAADNLLSLAEGQAREILETARSSAAETIVQAHRDSEQIKKDAHQNAFEQGYQEGKVEGSQEGYREGMARAVEEGKVIRAQAVQVLEQAEEIRRRTLFSLEQEIIDLSRDIAEKFITAQLTLYPEVVLGVVRESLMLVADRLSVVIHINPDEMELVERKREELQGLLPVRAELQVIADDQVLSGGCRVETEIERVDATVETRREALIKALYARE